MSCTLLYSLRLRDRQQHLTCLVCTLSNEDRAEDLHSSCAYASLCRGFTHSSFLSCMIRRIRDWSGDCKITESFLMVIYDANPFSLRIS